MLMKRVFVIKDGSEASREMDVFLNTHKTINVNENYNEKNGYWSYSVEFDGSTKDIKKEDNNRLETVLTVDKESTQALIGPGRDPNTGKLYKGKDYLFVLPREHFARFAVLRESRITIAREDNDEAYKIMTDVQATESVKDGDLTSNSLKNTKGFGDKKYKKYADRLLNYYDKFKEESYERYLDLWDRNHEDLSAEKTSDTNQLETPEVPDSNIQEVKIDDVDDVMKQVRSPETYSSKTDTPF